jgi:hypothetical protein
VKVITVVLVAAAAMTPWTAASDHGRSAVAEFELVVTGEREAVPPSLEFPNGIRNRGTFSASAPFCASGTFVDLSNDFLNSFQDTRRYTCSDGSGTLITLQEHWYEVKLPFTDTWSIVSGTDRYANLRGRGTFRGEILTRNGDDPLAITFRSVMRGLVAFDALAPTIAVSSTRVTKLRRPARTYSIRVTFSLRDNEAQDSLSYLVAVEPEDGGLYLAQKQGSTATGKVTVTLRVKPASGAKKVLLHVRGEDAVGNWRWLTRPLKLPR